MNEQENEVTDRELLEAAAKAAGIDMQTKAMFGVDPEPGYYLVADGTAPIWFWWNPLTDDGDALRLAVRLEMEIDICRTGIAVRTTDGRKVLEGKHAGVAATRRAIVRAAAAMAVGEA